MNITRRDALQRLGAGTLLALGFWPGALKARDAAPSTPFRFAVLNDIHCMSPECGVWLEDVVRQIKSGEKIDFCLIAGDLTEKGGRREMQAVRKIFKGLDVPVFVEIGNHDYLTQTDRRAYEKTFRRRINYYFKNHGWQFLGLDTTDGLRYEKIQVQGETFSWLRDHLYKLDKKAPLVIFTHFPLGPGVRYRPANAEVLLEMFRDHNLQAVLSGHFHGRTERRLGNTTLTTNACCALKRGNHDGSKAKGYFICTASDGQLSRQFVEHESAAASPQQSQSNS